SHEEFEMGKPLEPMNLILEFLRSNSRYAYTQSEITGELALRGMILEKEEVREILSLLEAWGEN
ncbi:MAG: hypothetical protein QMC90_04660, partial [Dehalococcoidales bacterium]|nr:hypothetical protein [Dehalococcoidales bacterium]